MSGIGENPSDPARAESRKRKECPDQLGPRFVRTFYYRRIETFCKDLEETVLCTQLNAYIYFASSCIMVLL